MAQLNEGRVDIISRDDGTLISQANGGYSHDVVLSQPSVVRINGTRAMVASYERQGNDLILHMQDGTTVRYRQFFFEDVDGEHSELVFDDGVHPPEHALFPVTAEGVDATTAVAMTPTYESLSSIDPLLLAGTETNTGVMTAAGFGALGALGAIVGIAANAGGGGGGGGDGGGGTTPPQTPAISINPFAGDNVLDNTEKNSAQTLSGTTTNVEAGQIVTIVLGGVTYTTAVGADGSWSISVPSAALQALAEGTSTITVTVSNAAGTQASSSLDITVDGEPAAVPTISINTFAEDNVLDGAEKQIDQTLSGTTTDVEAGRTVTITLGGVTYSAIVQSDGSWSVSVPSAALEALADGTTTITASVTNAAGAVATDTSLIEVNSNPSIAISPVSGDGYLNADEALLPMEISGTSSGLAEGSVVIVTLNNKVYVAVTQADGSWSTTVPSADLLLLADGPFTVTAASTDGSNQLTDSAQLNVLTTLPNASIDPPFGGDAVLNGAEAGVDQTITGSTGVSGPGQTVVVTVGGITYPATVESDGSWSVTIPSGDLANLPEGNLGTIEVEVTDPAGNTNSSSTPIVVDTLPPALALDGPISGDGYLNVVESGQALTISGTGEEGAAIVVTLNGETYTATVTNGEWTVSVPATDVGNIADGSYDVTVTATDSAGNVATTTSPLTVIADPANLPSITVTAFAGDNVLDGAEQQTEQFVTGTTSNVQQGQTVTITFGNNSYTGVVQASGDWSVAIPASALAGLTNGTQSYTVSVQDAAGNPAGGTENFTVDTTLAAIAFDPISGDGYLNATEAQSPLSITGTSLNVAPGATISVVFGGTTYTTSVGSTGAWSVTIPASALENLSDGPLTVTASTPGAATAQSTLNVAVTTLPQPTLDTPFGDGTLNNAESQTEQTLTGTTGVSGDGQQVAVTVGGVNYTATVDSDGNWSVDIPASALQNLTNGTSDIVVNVTDAAGNNGSLTTPVTVDKASPTITIEPIAQDNLINATEQDQPLLIEGETKAGSTVTVTLNGIAYPATVDSSGFWSTTIPASVLQGLNDGPYNVTVAVTDSAGNTSSQSTTVTLSTATPVFTLATVAGDGMLNSAESGQPLTIQGTGTVGDTVTVTLHGQTYTTTVDNNGGWSVEVPTTDLAALANGSSYAVGVTVADAAGNSASQQATLAVDTSAPSVTVNPVAGDGVLNATEQGQPLVISGTGTAGDTVTVTLNGEDYVVDIGQNGQWSVTIPAEDLAALNDTSYPVSIVASDAAGNTTPLNTTLVVNTAAPALTVNAVAGDNVVNATEQGQPLAVSGTGDVGDTITVTLNGVSYTTTVVAGNTWSLNIPASALEAIDDGPQSLTVTATSSVGNTTTAPATTLTFDTDAPALTVDPISGDGYLSQQEAGSALVITGTGDTNDDIVVTFNGIDYPATVVNGQWSVEIPSTVLAGVADGPYTVSVTATDAVGNTSTVTSPLTVVADPANQPTITIDISNFAGDGILDGAEQTEDQLLLGGTTNVEAGRTITVTLGTETFTGVVQSGGVWSVVIPASAFAGLTNGDYTFSATVTDRAGNEASDSQDFTVNNTDPAISIGIISGDNYLNAEEAAAGLVLNGSSSNLAENTVVVVNFNGINYFPLIGADGKWSVNIAASELTGLTDGPYVFTASATDGNGNTVSTTHTLNVLINELPQLTLNAPFGDSFLSADEMESAQTLSGSTGVSGDGQSVTVTIGGIDYQAEIDSAGNWTVSIPASALQGLADGSSTIAITASDAAGNTDSLTAPFTVDTVAPQITVNPVSGDGLINAIEQAQDLVVRGTAEAGGTVTVTLNGVDYTATVLLNGSWSATIPASALQALTDGNYDITVTATDAAGNSANALAPFKLDTGAPAFTLGTIAGDGTLNVAEQGQPLAIGGTGTAGDTVSVTLNGNTYTATVGSNGQWSVSVPASDLGALTTGSYPVSVTVSDAAGNSTSQQTSLAVDVTPPAVTISSPSGNGILSTEEQGQPLVLSGSGESGNTITVTLNGKTYQATVGVNGQWSVEVPTTDLAALSEGDHAINVTARDPAGNTTTVASSITLDNTQPDLTVNLATFAGNGVVDGSELQLDQVLTGTTTAQPGQTVTVSVNGNSYTGLVQSDGSWHVTLPAGSLAGQSDGSHNLTVSVSNAQGNSASTSGSYTINTSASSLAMAPISGDGYLSATEAQQPLLITGQTTNVVTGTQVQVTVNNVTYTGQVAGDGSWTVSVPAGALAGVADGTLTVSATVTDATGATVNASAPLNVLVNAQPNATINTPFGDGVLNAADVGSDGTLTGSTGITGAGQSVSVNIGGTEYTGTVATDGSWSISIPASALQGLSQGDTNFTVTVTDVAGNSDNASGTVRVDTEAPALALDTLSGDGIVNLAEKGQPLEVSGSGETGSTITVNFNGVSYTTTVAGGSWSLDIPQSAIGGLADGSYSVQVTATDTAGNSSQQTGSFTVKADASVLPSISFNAFAGNNIVDGAEQQTAHLLSGTTTNVEAGQLVTITLGSTLYTAVVQASGAWSVEIPAAELEALNNGTVTFNAAVTDVAGNSASNSLDVEINNLLAGLSVDVISTDGYLNAAEAASALTISGTSSNVPQGNTITVQFNNQTFTTTVGANGVWSLVIPAESVAGLPDGVAQVNVSAVDANGNPVSGSGSVDVHVNDLPVASIQPPFGDSYLSTAEAASTQVLRGSTGVSGDGQTVNINIGGVDYSGVVDSNGNWTLSLPSSVLQGLSAGDGDVVVTVTDAAGNTSTVTAPFTVDFSAPDLTIGLIAGDDKVNATEAQSAITVTGTTTAEAGQVVTITLNGQTYTATVDATGGWTLDLPAGALAGISNGSYTLTATVTDAAGNPVTETSTITVATSLPQPTIDTPFTDGYLSISEAQSTQTLTGTTGLTGTDQSVVVTIDGNTYTADVDSDGNWSLELDSTTLQNLSEGNVPITITVTDDAGNQGSTSSSVDVDFTAPTLAISIISGDDIINAAESLQSVAITGTASDVDAGQTVTLTFNGQTYQTLVQSDGSWSVNLPSSVLQGLADGAYDIDVTLTDKAGNTSTDSRTVTLDAAAADLPTLAIDATVSGDNYINQEESTQSLTVSGTSTNLEVGRTITVTLNGQTTTAQVVSGGTWTATFDASVVSGLSDGAHVITATATDVAGNPASSTHTVTVVASASSQPTISINEVAGDDIVSAQEANSPMTISGSSQRIPANSIIEVTLNNKTYQATVDANGNWSTEVPAADVQALPQDSNTITATGEDVAGNVAEATHDFTVDTIPPLLDASLDVGTDGILNLAEALAGLLINGETDPGLTVTLVLNTKVYSVIADENGIWSITIPSGDLLQLADGSVEVGVSVTDSNGNTTTELLGFDVQVNTLPALTVVTPFVDGVLNAIEASTDQVLTGVATNLAVGTVVTVTIGTITLTGSVTAANVWSVDVPAGALATLLDGTVQIDITAEDSAGNPATVTTSLDVVIHNLPVAAIGTPFGDGALNAVEAATDQILQGTTGITGAGQTATLSIDGQAFTVTVDEYGNWSATLPSADLLNLTNGTHTIELTVTDTYGNTDTDTLDFNAILTGLPQPTLDTPFTDGIINAVEAAAGGTLTGSLGITTLTGTETVTVTINGIAYPAGVNTVAGTWSLDLSSSLLSGLQNGSWPVSVSVTDSAGNVVSIDSSLTIAKTLPSPTINLPFGDGALNITEAASIQTLSGKTGISGAGQTVSIEITNGTGTLTLPATVDSNGNWTLSLSPAQLQTLTDGTHTITVTATDSAQNTNTANLTVTTALTAPDPVINTPFGDGILSISEAAAGVTLTGSTGVSGLNQGVQLKIDLNGVSYTGTVDSSGAWSVTIPAGALSSLGSGTHTINVTVTDSAGNSSSESLNFTAALTAPTPTVDLPFIDGYVNAQEALNGGVLTGKTGVTGAGQTVSVTINGTAYAATVDNGGNWTLNVAASVLAALGQDANSLTVVAIDSNGNSATTTASFIVDTVAPSTTVVFSAGADLDYLESLTTQTLSGVTNGAPDGSTVTVTIGTTTLTTVVNSGAWSVSLTPAVLALLGGDGATGNINVQVRDAAGNTGANSVAVTVDLTIPDDALVTLTPVTGDNILNIADGTGLVTLSGTYANLGDLGGALVITVNGVEVDTLTVNNSSGTWSIQVPSADFVDGTTATVVVSATPEGSTGSVTATANVLVDRTAPTVSIDAFASDDILNITEAAAAQTITGTASTSEAGRVVTVTLGGKTYTAVVQSNGTWSLSVPSADLQALGQDGQVITANLTDAAGNAATEATRTITVDTTSPLLEVDALLGDNVITAADILLTQTLTGTATGAAGQTIGLYLGDSTPIATAVVQSNGTFSINLTPEVLGSLTDGTLVFGLRVSDAAGNQTDATLTVNKVVNAALTVVVDSVFGDGFLSAADTLVAQTISGITTSAGTGATVSLVIGGSTLTASVGQDGKWAIVVPPSLLQLLDDGTIPLSLTVTDAYGNTAGASTSVTAIIDSVPVIGSLVNLLAGDNLLNVAEAAVSQVLTLPVTAATGSTVTVTLGTKSYTAALSNGNWTVTIPSTDLTALPTGNLSLGVSVVDPAGNTSSSSVSVGIFTSTPTITLNPIFGDGILNIADLATGQVISGVVNNVAAGTVITLTIGTATVNATVGQNGAFSVTVGTDILSTLTSGTLSIGAALTDAAGNTANATGSLLVDVVRPVVTLTSLLGDGLLNATEALTTQTITGTVTGADSGSKVVVTIGGQQFTTVTSGNSFTLSLTPAQLQGLLDGNLTVSVAVTDSAGNTGTASGGVTVGIHNLPSISLDTLFGDGALSLVESLVTQTITGTVSNIAAGTQLTISLGNTTVIGTVGANGRFTATVTPDILGTLLSGNLTVGISYTDAVGNTTSVSTGLKVGITNTPTLTMNTVFGDGILNAADLNSTQTISGSSTNLSAGTTVTVTIGGKTYTTLVASGGSWSVTVSKADLALLSDGTLTATATATDAYGNVATQSGTVSVIAHTAPTVTLGTLFGDGALNAVEALSAQTVSGTSTNAEGSTVTLRIGTLTLTGTVAANGSWSISVPSASLLALADGTQAVSVSVTNAAGNTGSATGSVLVGTHTTPTVAMSSIFGGDGYLNLTEASTTETISGTSTNAVGGTVSVNVAGTVFTTTVASNGTWSISIPSTTLKNITDGSHTVTVTLSDRAGNTTTTSSTFTAKTHDLPLLGVDAVGGDILGNVLSLLTNGLTVSGSTRYLATGTVVSVTLNGTTKTATVDSSGRYSVKFAGNLLSGLTALSAVTVSATDVAGNLGSTTTTLALGSLLPLATTAAAAVATFSVAADDATSVDTSSLATTSSSDEHTSAVATVATASTTEESSTTSETSSSSSVTTESSSLVTEESSTTTTEETTSTVADDSSYSIGGVMIVLADGTIHSGQESVTGSSGDDTITLTSLNFTHIDGGAGTDTLVLGGEHMTLDLTTLGLEISNIEVLDLGTSGTNILKLDLSDALKLTDKQGDDLIIKGADGNQVMLANTDGGVWSNTGQRTVDGQQFDVYHNSALASDNTLGDVLIQHNLQVHVV